jgi:phage tail-like protein
MGLPDVLDGATNWSWMITIDGISFSEVSSVGPGITLAVDPIDMKFNDVLGNYTRKKLPGKMQSGTLTMVRAAIGPPTGTAFADWLTDVYKGKMSTARKTITVTMLDYGAIPLAHFTFKNAWVHKIDYGTFKAGDASVLNETITIQHEGCYAGPAVQDW